MKPLIKRAIDVICFSGIIGIALKFITLFDKWIYFPFFPDIFDSIFLILASAWLFFRLIIVEKYIEILFSIKVCETLAMIRELDNDNMEK